MNKRRFILIVTLFAIFLPIFLMYSNTDNINADQGMIDITHWDFKNEPAVEIVGEWEVYNNTYTPEELKDKTPDDYADINYFDESLISDTSILKGTTYHLIIKNNKSDNFGLLIDDFYNDYKLYINGDLKIDKTFNASDVCCSESQKNNVLYFNSEGDIDLIFQVFRNNDLKDKKWSSVTFGTDYEIRKIYESKLSFDFILIGNSLMIAALFGYVFFFSKDYVKNTIGYLSLFGINLAFGAMLTGERVITNMISYVDYSFIFRGQQVFYHLTIIILLYLVNSYYDTAQKRVMNLFTGYTLVAILLAAFIPINIYRLFLQYLYMISVVIELYVLYILYHAYNKNYSDVIEILYGYLIIVFFTLNDALHTMQIIETDFIVNLGLALFIYINATIIFSKYLTQSVKADSLNKEVIELNKTLDQRVNSRTKILQDRVEKDSLTKIYNHEYLFKKLRFIHNGTKVNDGIYSVLMIDIDFFKSVNDAFGHQAGDDVLRKIASYLNTYRRYADIIGRYGGEEFMMILPDTGIENAYKVAEKHRLRISELEFDNKNIRITVSIGVAEYQRGLTASQIISLADERMYKAKASGRNNTKNE